MKRIFPVCRVITVFLSAAFLYSPRPAYGLESAFDVSRFDDQFAFKLYSSLTATTKGNVFYSPYSLTTALEMAYEGARGSTAREMSEALGLQPDNVARRSGDLAFIRQIDSTDKTYEFIVANAIWVQKSFPIKADYIQLIKDNYLAEARNLDFITSPEASRVSMNGWVLDRTKGHIRDLLPEGSVVHDTRLVITDAVYFKGKWEFPFNKSFTAMNRFWTAPDHPVQTPMMKMTHIFNFMEDGQVQILELPYQGHDLSMEIILPLSKKVQDLDQIMTADHLIKWQAQMMVQKVDINLPKFKFDTGYEMSDVLKSIGMKQAFDPMQADFTAMADRIPGNNLYISGVYHKAWIDTDEEGTEAAAATGITMTVALAHRVVPETIREFHADHPFVFIIRDDRSGQILFMGKVLDPREA